MPKYHINIFYCEEDGDYIANVPDLRGCSAFGDTPEDAVRELMIAMELWLEVADEEGIEIPTPKYKVLEHIN